MVVSQLLTGVVVLALAVEPVPVPAVSDEPATAPYLALEADDADAGGRLDRELYRALYDRGLSDGRGAPLPEFRQVFACDAVDVACMADAGRSLGSRRIIYGSLRTRAGGMRLEMVALDVGAGTIERKVEHELSAADLATSAIAATADRIAASLDRAVELPSVAPPPPPAPPPRALAEGPRADVDTAPRSDRGANWAWAGLGTSLGLAAVSIGIVAGSSVVLKNLSDKTKQAALDSLTDTYTQDYVDSHGLQPYVDTGDIQLGERNPANDVDPARGDLCTQAKQEIQDGVIRNERIASLCTRGVRLEKLGYAGYGMLAVSAVGIVAFAVVLGIQRRRGQRSQRMAVQPTWNGRGAGLSLAGRF